MDIEFSEERIVLKFVSKSSDHYPVTCHCVTTGLMDRFLWFHSVHHLAVGPLSVKMVKRSLIWDIFDKIHGTKSAKCLYCAGPLSCGDGNTTTMRRHLVRELLKLV